MAISRLTVVTSGIETLWGTPLITSTHKWLTLTDLPKFKPRTKVTALDEYRGSLAPAYNTFIPLTEGQWDLKGYVTFEEMIYYLYGALNGAPTIATVDANAGKSFTFPAPLTTPWTPKSYTYQFSHDGDGWFLPGSLPTKLDLSYEQGKQGEWALSGFSKLPVQTITTLSAPTPATLADPAVGAINYPEVVIPTLGNFKIALLPSTTVDTYSGTLISAKYSIDTGLHPKHFITGDLGPTWFGYDKYKVDASFVVEYTSTAGTGYSPGKYIKDLFTAALLNATPPAKNIYTLLTMPGTAITTTLRTLNHEFAGGLADDVQYWDTRDGNVTVSFKLTAVYDAAILSNYFKTTVISRVAALV